MLSSEFSVDDFKVFIQSEIQQYNKSVKTKGASVPIYVDEDCAMYIRNAHLLLICDYFLNDKLNSVEISYIADCITLAESITFENLQLRELVESMTDPEINGLLTKESVTIIHKVINEHL